MVELASGSGMDAAAGLCGQSPPSPPAPTIPPRPENGATGAKNTPQAMPLFLASGKRPTAATVSDQLWAVGLPVDEEAESARVQGCGIPLHSRRFLCHLVVSSAPGRLSMSEGVIADASSTCEVAQTAATTLVEASYGQFWRPPSAAALVKREFACSFSSPTLIKLPSVSCHFPFV